MTQYAHVGARTVAALPRLRHIARYGVGLDIVDVEPATAAGVLVTNVPADYCRDEVADHALAMLLYFARKLRVYDEAVHGGVWRWQAGAPVHRLRGSRLGVVGLGNIRARDRRARGAFRLGDRRPRPVRLRRHGRRRRRPAGRAGRAARDERLRDRPGAAHGRTRAACSTLRRSHG